MKNKITAFNLLKFILGSAIGIVMFLVPISDGSTFNTMVGIITDFIESISGNLLPFILVLVTCLNGIISLYDYICKPKWIRENKALKAIFSSSPLYMASKVLAGIFAAMVFFKIGPDMIISGDTGGTMLSLGITIGAMAIPLSYAFPLLTECGIMEFVGILLKPLVRPLFKVPGRASVDLITSWFGASNAAAVFSREQYFLGYYTAKEAAIIMTNFSLVSVPFCLVVAKTLDLTNMFPSFYLTICVVGFLLAFIMPRIAPLKNIENTYYNGMETKLREEVPEEHNIFKYAIAQSCDVAEHVTFKSIIKGGSKLFFDLILNLIPIIISWGTIGLIIVEYTPFFNWIAYPFGVYLDLLGVESAFAVAPATITGFVDMFIPALLVTGIESVKTKFIIGVLSLVQIIYMTEVGAVIIQSKIKVNILKLLGIFLIRTVIALPMIVFAANLIIK